MNTKPQTYEQWSEELANTSDRSTYQDTTNESGFLEIRIAALKKQRELIDKQIDGMEQLVRLAHVG